MCYQKEVFESKKKSSSPSKSNMANTDFHQVQVAIPVFYHVINLNPVKCVLASNFTLMLTDNVF